MKRPWLQTKNVQTDCRSIKQYSSALLWMTVQMESSCFLPSSWSPTFVTTVYRCMLAAARINEHAHSLSHTHRTHTHSLTHPPTHTQTHALTHTHNTYTHSLTHTHTHTHTPPPHTHTHTHSAHSDNYSSLGKSLGDKADSRWSWSFHLSHHLLLFDGHVGHGSLLGVSALSGLPATQGHKHAINYRLKKYLQLFFFKLYLRTVGMLY